MDLYLTKMKCIKTVTNFIIINFKYVESNIFKLQYRECIGFTIMCD